MSRYPKGMKDLLIVVLTLVAVVALLFATPVMFLWSVNTLFEAGISFSFRNLLASWTLLFVVWIVTRTNK